MRDERSRASHCPTWPWTAALSRQSHEVVEAGAGDGERDAGETRGEQVDDGEAVERARLATLRRVVPRHRVRLRHEEIAHRVRIAGGSPQTDDAPDVGHLSAAGRKQHGPALVAAVRAPARGAVGLVDRAIAAEPRGV